MKRLVALALVVGLVCGIAAAASAHGGNSAVTWGRDVGDSPAAIANLPMVDAVQAANWGGLAEDESGHVWQWVQSPSPSATEETGPNDPISLGEGYWFSAVVDGSGDLWTWGKNGGGDLCQDTFKKEDTRTPARVPLESPASAVSGGASHLMILMNDGKVESCGDNNDGQLGDGSNMNADTPVVVEDLDDIVSISSGDTFDVALNSTGQVFEWGDNRFGQLGDGTESNSDVPVAVSLPSPAAQIYAGGSTGSNGQTIALLKNGEVFAWGNNKWGQLGDGSQTNSDIPVQIHFTGNPVITSVATGGQTTFAIDGNGNLYAWGDNHKGQYGDGSTGGNSFTPKVVGRNYTLVSSVADELVAMESASS
jgi:alpha-tubulin suppressor-like RCC1 family protein